MSESRFKADSVAKALQDTSSPYRVADDIEIKLARFPSGRAAYGEPVFVDMAEWARYREECISRPWPKPDKDALPAEVGALLNSSEDGRGLRRRGVDVQAMTWIFVDSDGDQSGLELRRSLDALCVAYLMTESATSRYDGRGVKWHLFLPLARPAELPSRSQPNIDAAASLRAQAAWWQAVNDHVGEALFGLGGLKLETRDRTAGSFPRMAFVPHAPPDDKLRRVQWKEGRLLVLDEFLRATGAKELAEPPLVRVDQKLMEGRSETVAEVVARVAGVNFEGGDDDGGATAGETTGSLVHFALNFLGYVGPRDSDPNAFQTLCPWRENHTPTDKHDPERHDDSVLVYVKGAHAGESGGFKCMHNGSGAPGQCSRAGAGDVLRWARKNGVPLPDRPEWGGKARPAVQEPAGDAGQGAAAPSAQDAPAAPPEAKDAKPARPRPPAFPGAPNESTPPATPRPYYQPRELAYDAKVVVTIDDSNLHRTRNDAIRAIEQHPKYFRIGGGLVDVVFDAEQVGAAEKDKFRRPWVRKASFADLLVELCSVSRWVVEKESKNGVVEVEVRPDKQIVASVLAAGSFPRLRPLNAIVSTPVFRRDGTLLQQPGYDLSTGFLYYSDKRIPLVSPNPGRTELRAAFQRLRAILKGYEDNRVFPDPDLACSVFFSMVFTPLLRYVISALFPMYCVTANDAGGGKTLLSDCANLITAGEAAEIIGFSGDEPELERLIGSALKRKSPMIVFDNVPRGTVFASSIFDRYLTGTKFSTREIKTSNNIEKEVDDQPMLVANGNGLQIGGDLIRRSLWIEIDDRSGSPTQRRVEVADLREFCRTRRPELLGAALTLLSGFFAARRSGWSVELPIFASFERWSIVREAVVWCGLPDPFEARGRVEDDVEGSRLRHVIAHVRALVGEADVGVGRLCEQLKQDYASAKPKHAAAYEFFSDAGVRLDSGSRNGASSSMGKFLRQMQGRTFVDGEGKWQIVLGSGPGGVRTVRASRVK